MTSPAPVPLIGADIEIDLPDGTVTGTVANRRPLGPDLWCLVVNVGPGARVLTVARAEDGGWATIADHSIGLGIQHARAVLTGRPYHGSVNEAMRAMADALLALAGIIA